MQTLEKFLEGSKLVLRSREVRPNRNHTDVMIESWAAKRYLCEVRGSHGDRRFMTTIVGSDNGPPALPDVLDVIAAEAAVADDAGSYEEWAVQMGFNPDSRRGELIYRASRRQAKVLRRLLGDESYKQLLWETERL